MFKHFQDWFNSVDYDTFDPYVPGLITSDWLHMHNSMGKRHMTWVRLRTNFDTDMLRYESNGALHTYTDYRIFQRKKHMPSKIKALCRQKLIYVCTHDV
jgi:hypothetical protein